jgi:hypothetical protein
MLLQKLQICCFFWDGDSTDLSCKWVSEGPRDSTPRLHSNQWRRGVQNSGVVESPTRETRSQVEWTSEVLLGWVVESPSLKLTALHWSWLHQSPLYFFTIVLNLTQRVIVFDSTTSVKWTPRLHRTWPTPQRTWLHEYLWNLYCSLVVATSMWVSHRTAQLPDSEDYTTPRLRRSHDSTKFSFVIFIDNDSLTTQHFSPAKILYQIRCC